MDGRSHIELDLTRPAIHAIVEQHPERIHGFKETDARQFFLPRAPCSFTAGTKALGEEVIAGLGQSYVWRLRIPFDEVDNKPQITSASCSAYPKVYDNVNSVSHRADFAKACVDLWEMHAPFVHLQHHQPRFHHRATRCHVDPKISKAAARV